MNKLPDFARIVIPGVKDYYAGDDGKIYKAKEKNGKVEMFELSPQYPDEKFRIKYVNIKVYSSSEGLINRLFAVHFLVKLAFDGYYPYGFKVIFKDKDYSNTQYKNLEWDLNSKNTWKNDFVYV